MLKGRLKFLLKRIDIPLCCMLDLVMACICLNNVHCQVKWLLYGLDFGG
jgi:hypothetical protein